MNKVYDIKGAAAFSGVKGHVLRHFIRRGILPSQKLAGDRHILHEAELKAFLVRYRSHEFDGRYKKV